jgi:SPOR domain
VGFNAWFEASTMADNNFRSYRSRDPVTREGADQTARRGSGDPLAELARLIGKSDPFVDPVHHDTYSDERPDGAQPSGVEWGAEDNDPEQQRPAEERYVTPPRKEPLPFLTQAPQEQADESEAQSGGGFFSPPPPRFNGFREDDAPDFPAAAESASYHDEAQPASPAPDDDRPPVLPPRQAPAFPPAAPGERAVAEIQAAEVGEAYGADDYDDDAPTPRRRGGLVLVIAVLGLAALGTAGAFAYRAMFGGSVLPSLPPIIKAGNGPNKIVPGYGDARTNSSAQTTAANTGSSEKIVSHEEQPVEIQETPKTSPRVISTIPIAPNPSGLPPGASSVGAAPFAPAPAATAPAAAPPVVATVPVPPPAPAPASAEPKKIHTVTIRSDQSGGTDAGAGAPAPQHGPARSAKMSAKPSAAAPAPAGNRPLSLAPDSQGDAAAPPPPAAPAPSRPRAHAAVATATPAGGAAAETASSGGYAVQVTSQRSEADAHSAFRTLRAKYPTQLGGREPIVRRADLGAKGIYFRAMVGPFASMEEAAGMCSNLKAAGGTCLVQRN